MGMQLKVVTKEECHKLIDDLPGNSVFIMTYDDNIGVSDNGKHIKKKKSKKYVDRANVAVLIDDDESLTKMINLKGNFNIIRSGNDITKSILLPKLE